LNNMSDIIFIISISSVRRNGLCTFETALCKNVYNKDGKYRGGYLQFLCIEDMPDCVDNLSTGEFDKLKSWLSKDIICINKHSYYVSSTVFHEFVKGCLDKHILYCSNEKNKLVLIDDISMRIEEDEVARRKTVRVTKLPSGTICFDSRRRKLYIDDSLVFGGVNDDMTPQLHLVKDQTDDDIYHVVFSYCGHNIPYGSTLEIFESENGRIVRKYGEERTLLTKAAGFGFKKKTVDTYLYNGMKKLSDIQNELRKNNIFILSKPSKDDFDMKFAIASSNKDWFDIKLQYIYKDQVYDMVNRMDILSTGKEVNIDGKVFALPDSFYANLSNIVVEDGKMRLPKRYLLSAMHIADETGDNISHFIEYTDITVELPGRISSIIRPYQIDGVKWLKWLVKNRLGGCLADDMGLGKTLQVIALLSESEVRKTIRKTMIIVPVTLITNWHREIEKFSDGFTLLIYHGADRDIKNTEFDICITTYLTAVNDIDILSSIFWDCVIFDEIQHIKNYHTKSSITLKRLRASTRIGLSGTPIENNIEELWNILDILNPGVIYSKRFFVMRYGNNLNYMELHKLLKPFVMRRTKKDVLSDLPSKTEEMVYCDFSDEERDLYNSIRLAVRRQLSLQGNIGSAMALKGLLLLRQCCCHTGLLSSSVNVDNLQKSAKLDVLEAYVSNLYESNHKILIFSQFTKMLAFIRKRLEGFGYHIFYLDGQTRERQSVVDDFEKAENGVFLISLKAGGTGLNLVSAQDIIIYDPWWNPFAEEQAADRAYRIGQKNNVTVYKMIISDSIEEKILDLQRDKYQLFDDTLNHIPSDQNIFLDDILALL